MPNFKKPPDIYNPTAFLLVEVSGIEPLTF